MRKPLSLDYVERFFIKSGYKLLSTEYKNSRTKLKYECPNGHIGFIKWDHFRDGHRCSGCSGNKKIPIDVIKKSFESGGYELLTTEYDNSNSKLSYRCPKGHENSMSWNNWHTGYRCPDCASINKRIKFSLGYDFVKKCIEKEDYVLLSSEYMNAFEKLSFVCDKGHFGTISWNEWQRGLRCSKCGKIKSIGESELISFIDKLRIEYIENDRNLIKPYELDVVIPSKQIAIEYCGLYWHSELAGKDKNYHLYKLRSCEEKGYKLITVFEDEFVHKRDIVESRLKHILNRSDCKKIYARNCYIKDISYEEANNFCNKYHLQGYVPSNIKLGAFYGNELVSVMTFAKPSVAKGSKVLNKNGMWELSRFCVKNTYQVVGIASKLIKYFLDNYHCVEIISYADRRWSSGDLYEKLGFKYVGTTCNNYWYINGDKRVHRFALRKTNKDPRDQTEWQVRRKNGYNRIWDCGNLKYVKKVNM